MFIFHDKNLFKQMGAPIKNVNDLFNQFKSNFGLNN